jgi:hypothetical protein
VVATVRKVRTRVRAVVVAKNSTSDPANAVAVVAAEIPATVVVAMAMAAAVLRRKRSKRSITRALRDGSRRFFSAVLILHS